MLAMYIIQHGSTTFSTFAVAHHCFARGLYNANDHYGTPKCSDSPRQVRLGAPLTKLHVA